MTKSEQSKYNLRDVVWEYVENLTDYDLALWIFVLGNFVITATLTVFVLNQHGAPPSAMDELKSSLTILLIAGLGILIGRPALTMIADRAAKRWSSNDD